MVMKVIEPPIRDGCLWRDRLQRRMCVDHPRRRIESRIRDAPLPDATVVVLHVGQQPFNRVVRVRTLVHILRPFLLCQMRRHVLERPLRHVASSHILVDENKAIPLQLAVRPQTAAKCIRAIGPDRVTRAHHENRVGLFWRRVDRRVDGRKEMYAVAHRDPVFDFRVTFA